MAGEFITEPPGRPKILNKSKTKCTKFSDTYYFWLKEEGIMLTKDFRAFSIPTDWAGGSIWNFLNIMFPLRPMPKGATVMNPVPRDVGLYTRPKDVAPHGTHKIPLARVLYY